jgi:hypothetical protein
MDLVDNNLEQAVDISTQSALEEPVSDEKGVELVPEEEKEQMPEIEIRTIYNVDTITQEKGWKLIYDNLIGIDKDTWIVFKNVRLKDPSTSTYFKQLLKENEHIYVRFINADEIMNSMRITCIFMGIEPNRIDNVVIETVKPETPQEQKLRVNGTEMYKSFKVDKGTSTATFDFNKKYPQLENSQSIAFCRYAIDILIEEGIKTFNLIIGDLSTSDAVLAAVAKLIYEYDKEDIAINVDINSQDRIKVLKLYLFKLNNKPISTAEKLNIAKELVHNGTPGLLQRYKKSKALDDFGRQGNGEVLSCRISVCRGFNDLTSEIIFDTYDDNEFLTSIHWSDLNDNEVASDIQPERVTIPIDEIGICDKFLGSRYHFMYPIQRNKDENVKVRYIDNDDSVKVTDATIPERMKIVFDDRGIKYDSEQLDEFITKVKEIVEK